MSRAKDFDFAERCNDYDLIIGGHSHDTVDTIIGRTVIGQTGARMHMVGATRIRMRNNEVIGIDYENIPLDRYGGDAGYAARVARIEGDPELNASVGTLASDLNRTGIADMLTTLIADAADADVGFYHYGGIRLLNMAAGEVSKAKLFNIAPFLSHICTAEMTPAQMRAMIIAKYNGGISKESHRIDLFSTTPYTVVLDDKGDAADVIFPRLREDRTYKVAMADYIGRKYRFEAKGLTRLPMRVFDLLVDHFREHSPVAFSNEPKQSAAKTSENMPGWLVTAVNT